MQEVSSKLNGSTLIIYLFGRVDSTNATKIEEELNNIISNNTFSSINIDLENLQYISSAGLRLILKLKKTVKDTKIINANTEVYEIFEMTGFTEMMTVEKAYKRISVDGCEVIGKGANGEVYRIDEDTIVKVYLNSDSLPDIQRERDLARKAFVLGVPTAISYDVVKVNEGYGSVFELLNCKSITKLLNADIDNFDKYVTMYVDLLKLIHSTEVKPNDMPNIKTTVLGWVDFLKDYLPEDKYSKLKSLVSDVPENLHMIHGDYHTNNVMNQNGEALLIDMDTLAYGDPVFEFASIYNAFVGFSALDHNVCQSFLKLPYDIAQRVWKKTLELYFNTTDKDKLQEIENKASLIGYTRLMRRLIRRKGLETEEGRKTIEFYKTQIIELLDKVNKLTF